MKARILVWLLAAATVFGASPEAQRWARSVKIYRDRYGVPHIDGRTDASVVFGLMYAQAEDNFEQLEQDYIRALGRSAEARGPAGLANDLSVRLWEVEKNAKAEYARMDAAARTLCDAFAAGLNYYLERRPEVKPALITRFEPWHILAWQLAGAGGAAASAGVTPADRQRLFPFLPAATSAYRDGEEGLDEGSNMWAVGPSKSANAKALLMINPHVGFFGGGQRYEAHLKSGQGLEASGFAILCSPYLRTGFNRDHGWSHTNNYADIGDVYLETFDDPARPLAYRYGSGYRTAVEWTDEIKVKTPAGMETRTVTLRKTHHGPVVGMRNGKFLAVRVAMAERPGLMEQRIAMARARNLAEFEAALARRTLTGSNTLYADRAGNIFYLHGNAVPKRSTKFDWRLPVDGSDPETEWQGFHEMSELPQWKNPPSGYLQNCNSTPLLAGGEGGPGATEFPAYMMPEKDNLRSEMSRRILSGKKQFTFEEWARAATDTYVLAAEKELPALIEEAERERRVPEAVAELKAWDRVSRIDSAAMTLFMRWRTQYATGGSRTEALETVVRSLQADFGTWRVPWGEVNRLQRVHTSGTEEPFSDARPSVPVAGAPGVAGIIFAFNARVPAGQKRAYGASGNTYVAVVEFGRKMRARSVLVFGQSADAKSPHWFDQGDLYAKGQFKPAWFDWGEVKRNTERVYRPGQ